MVSLLVGLIFFVTGSVIALQYFQYRHLSSFRLVQDLWLLAVFGLGQAAGRLGPPFLPAPAGAYVEIASLITSYTCLYAYGARLLARTRPTYRLLPWAVFFAASLWFAIYLALLGQETAPLPARLNASLVWAEGLLALPGSLLVALALTSQVGDFLAAQQHRLLRQLYGAVASFSLYALLAGLEIGAKLLLLPNWPDWSASPPPTWLNAGTGLATIGMGYYLLRLMQLFDLEHCKKLDQAQQQQLVLQERLRIGRELHDGIIQSLYGLGLSLQNARRLVRENPEAAENQLDDIMRALDATVERIRCYINELSLPDLEGHGLVPALTELAEKFREQTGLQVAVDLDYGLLLNSQQAHHLYHIVQEALNNVVKHAAASRVTVSLENNGNYLILTVSDDGKGFAGRVGKKGSGLKNMEDRARLLGGKLNLLTTEGGTCLKVTVPMTAGGESHAAKNQAPAG